MSPVAGPGEVLVNATLEPGWPVGPITQAWFPVHGHPQFDSASTSWTDPWYLQHADGLVTSGAGNPIEALGKPCFEARDGLIYPLGQTEPWFQQLGSFLYPTDTHPSPTVVPWFQAHAVPGGRRGSPLAPG